MWQAYFYKIGNYRLSLSTWPYLYIYTLYIFHGVGVCTLLKLLWLIPPVDFMFISKAVRPIQAGMATGWSSQPLRQSPVELSFKFLGFVELYDVILLCVRFIFLFVISKISGELPTRWISCSRSYLSADGLQILTLEKAFLTCHLMYFPKCLRSFNESALYLIWWVLPVCISLVRT